MGRMLFPESSGPISYGFTYSHHKYLRKGEDSLQTDTISSFSWKLEPRQAHKVKFYIALKYCQLQNQRPFYYD